MSVDGLLTSASLEEVLRDLSRQSATGCLVVRDPAGDDAEVFLKDGKVYAVAVPGRRAMLGARLMSSGALSPDALADALEIQRNELQGWRLGELLVHLGYVDREVVEALVVEQLQDSLGELLARPYASSKFRRGRKTRQDVAPPSTVPALLDELTSRRERWQRVLEETGGPTGVPELSSAAPSDNAVVLGPPEWAVLCKVDGIRTLERLAADCGMTLFEVGSVVVHLIDAGVVEVPLDDDEADLVEAAAPAPAPAAQPEGQPDDVDPFAAMLREASGTADDDADPGADADAEDDGDAPDPGALAASIGRLAASLAPAAPAAPAATAPTAVPVVDDGIVVREIAASSADPASKAPRQVDVERRLRDAEVIASMLEEQAAKDRAARAELLEAERLEAERLAEGQAARHEAERLARDEADQLARDKAEWAARQEAERVAREDAERYAREEAERQAREDAERNAREEAERQARADAERNARAEAERHAREEAERQAQADAERNARAEADQLARAEAERHAREEAERHAREHAEQLARAEAERQAFEEAERIARAEAERVAVEQAAERAAEQAARDAAEEAERRAIETAVRLGAEQDAREAAEDGDRAARERAQQELAAEMLRRSQQPQVLRPDAEPPVVVPAGDEGRAEDVAAMERARRELEEAAALASAPPSDLRVVHEPEAELAPGWSRASSDAPAWDGAQETETQTAGWGGDDVDAAAMIRELTGTMESPVADDAGDRPEEPPARPPAYPPADTDMASLLRELSSLGFGDETPPPPPPPAVTRPVQAAPPPPEKKKRKGLFGF